MAEQAQMVWVDAPAVRTSGAERAPGLAMAGVFDGHLGRDWPLGQNPRAPVDVGSTRQAGTHPAITVPVGRAGPEDAAVRLRVTHRPEGVCVSDTPGHGPIMPGGSDSAGPCGEHTVEADPAQRAADHGISHGTARMTLRAVITKRRSSPLPSSGTCGSVAIPAGLI